VGQHRPNQAACDSQVHTSAKPRNALKLSAQPLRATHSVSSPTWCGPNLKCPRCDNKGRVRESRDQPHDHYPRLRLGYARRGWMRRRVARRMRVVARCVTRPILNPSTCQRMESRISDSNGVKSIGANNVSTADLAPLKAQPRRIRVRSRMSIKCGGRNERAPLAPNTARGWLVPGVARDSDSVNTARLDLPLRSVGRTYPCSLGAAFFLVTSASARC
jgi:hypothetical protein